MKLSDRAKECFVLTRPDGTKIDEFDTQQSAYSFAKFRVDRGDYDIVECRKALWHDEIIDNEFVVDNISNEVLWTYPKDEFALFEFAAAK